MARCEECGSQAAEGAARCGQCGEVIGGKECPDCLSRSKEEARVCRWCGHRFQTPEAQVDVTPRSIRAKVAPSFLFRGRFIPQEVEITEEKLVVKAPGIFHLWNNETEIPWNKVSGFGYRDGMIWDRVTVETRGQESETVHGLAKAEGQEIRAILQSLER